MVIWVMVYHCFTQIDMSRFICGLTDSVGKQCISEIRCTISDVLLRSPLAQRLSFFWFEVAWNLLGPWLRSHNTKVCHGRRMFHALEHAGFILSLITMTMVSMNGSQHQKLNGDIVNDELIFSLITMHDPYPRREFPFLKHHLHSAPSN